MFADMSVVLGNFLSTVVAGVIVAIVGWFLNRKLNVIERNGNSKLSDAFDRIDALSEQVEGLGGKPSASAVPSGTSGRTDAETKEHVQIAGKAQAQEVAIAKVQDAVSDENLSP